MGGRLTLTGYNSTLLHLIQERQQMADWYHIASRDARGDKRDLLLRLCEQERDCTKQLEQVYRTLYCTMPHSATTPSPTHITINELIICETKSALRLSHLSKTAPTKQLFNLYKAMAQQSIQNGYLLLLTK